MLQSDPSERKEKPVKVCEYSAKHKWQGVPATTVLDCGPVVGKVPACSKCAEFYRKHQS